MPSVSEKQRRFFGAELARKRADEPTTTDMTEEQLEEFASKSRRSPPAPLRKAHRSGRRASRRAY